MALFTHTLSHREHHKLVTLCLRELPRGQRNWHALSAFAVVAACVFWSGFTVLLADDLSSRPLWITFVVAAIFGFAAAVLLLRYFWLRSVIRRYVQRHSDGRRLLHCLACSYDLQGSKAEDDRCPECGHAVLILKHPDPAASAPTALTE